MVFFMISTLMTTGKPAPLLDFSGLFTIERESQCGEFPCPGRSLVNCDVVSSLQGRVDSWFCTIAPAN
jgi:hypothetical protein